MMRVSCAATFCVVTLAMGCSSSTVVHRTGTDGGAEATPNTDGSAEAAPNPDGATEGGTEASTCPSGQEMCGGACADVTSDHDNCGSCFNACGANESCTGGTCQVECTAAQTNCSGTCVDEQTDNNHCGSCTQVCGTNQVCTNGACACAGSFTLCGATTGTTDAGAADAAAGDASSGGSSYCADLTTDPQNCGACGNVCPTGLACKGSSCASASCEDIKQSDSTAADGIYTIDPDGSGPLAPFSAYCDMTTDGGGWTMVARSVSGSPSTLPFGWGQATGSASDDTAPYSLDVTDSKLQFTQILFGSYSTGKTWVNAYETTVGADFIATYETTSHDFNTPGKILGSCDLGSTSMFRYLGYTKDKGIFHFQDNNLNVYGFVHDGWFSYWNDCPRGGDIDLKEGMIFVR